ncbi:N-acetyl sugar amidotransferase [Acidovorax kalamii]|uniref:ExsB family protein n=1 Tax=Acidovorax kalamii TaxID=2004485 RepID=A0A235ESY3_9BURK|nr:N-acetyl sugar amidotransferase [Acidovorax kalamii]OYD52111.1 ExsB family protein [Acidovorax kalamii]
MTYQICTRCIMDTSDPNIEFDAAGVCNHCRNFDQNMLPNWHPDASGRRTLDGIVAQMKREGQGRPYDCAIGLSGGVDSSYLAYVARKELGLRLLAVHVDGGWNSELATRNIENIVRKLDIDLHTYVVDWEEMQDLQRAFLRAGLANQDVPQDHAFFAALYSNAQSYGLRYVLSGGNISTESVMPTEWAYNAMDLRHLEAVHSRFGNGRLRSFPRVNFFRYYFWNRYVKRMCVVRPLNYLPYVKDEAIATLERELGFQYYGGKHFESRFTKWQQLFYRPRKFGYDERRAYLSSLILSEQSTRGEALAALAGDVENERQAEKDTEYILKKLAISEEEFRQIMDQPPRTFRDYPSNYALFNLKTAARDWLASRGIAVRPNS